MKQEFSKEKEEPVIKTQFAFEIVRDGQVVAAVATQAEASLIATTLRGEVREAVIAEITGEFSFSRDTIWFEDSDNRTSGFNSVLADALGIDFPTTTRGAGNTISLGYVTITIKAANKPPVVEEVKALEKEGK